VQYISNIPSWWDLLYPLRMRIGNIQVWWFVSSFHFRGKSFASVLLMVVIYAVVVIKGLRGFSGIAIGGIVGLDIFFLGLVPVLQWIHLILWLQLDIRLFMRFVVVLDHYFCWHFTSCIGGKKEKIESRISWELALLQQ